MRRKHTRDQDDVRRQMQERYNEYLEFIEFLKLSGSAR